MVNLGEERSGGANQKKASGGSEGWRLSKERSGVREVGRYRLHLGNCSEQIPRPLAAAPDSVSLE